MPSTPRLPDPLPLRDIHLPPAISWWPPAPGWWLLLLLLLLLMTSFCLLRRQRRRRYFQKLALCRLEALSEQYQREPNTRKLLQELSRLLRQATLLHFPQSHCAGLVGEDWLAFLDQRLNEKPFSQGVGRILADGPYLRQSENIDVQPLLSLCRLWLEQLPPLTQSRRRQA